ncbi:hypothetical protein GGX14DRAFT_632566 [Mycena pura]|uniref:SWIM-type domain-containing protein n=1 Tax=Mycena pura TaxID=153505 RepID=A0AAD6VGU2_9AGAR|nr:hypothetical protein GGX14DRAFT_632566 [Mycena pura]
MAVPPNGVVTKATLMEFTSGCAQVAASTVLPGVPPGQHSQPGQLDWRAHQHAEAAPSSTSANAPSAAYGKKIRWAAHDSQQQKNPHLSARTTAAVIPTSHLKVTHGQRNAIDAMYQSDTAASFPEPPIVDHDFLLDSDGQLQAAALMAHYGLDDDSREHVGNRWSQQWSYTSQNTEKTANLRRRNTKYDRNPKSGTQERHTAAPFTACLSHAEVTFRAGKVVRIRGHFHHNQGCKDACYARKPPIPVHPSVYAVALAQLRDGGTFADIRAKNRELFKAKAYKDFPHDLHSSHFRWLLEANDSRSLYRQYNRLKGIRVTDVPEVSIDEWLDPKSEKFIPTLAHAVFHYSARAAKEERFEVAVANEEMSRAAWTYGHESQIILDGTFGICSSRLLLFIIMVIDEKRRGVPVAFLFFSAPSGNKLSSSGYDTSILAKLLQKWSDSLKQCAHLYGRAGAIFSPVSAITDTDLKERGALVTVFPDIWLLICRFHLQQSWRNHRNRLLKGKTAVLIDLKHRMVCLEKALTATQTISEARSLLQAERQIVADLSPSHPRETSKAMKHVDYLDLYWTTDNLWKSWSDYGRAMVASILGCSIDGVIPTTNHLESFNGVLKRVHLRRVQNGGRKLRVDVLLHALVMYILPSIFEERRLYNEQATRVASFIKLLPGGAALLQERDHALPAAACPKIAYLVPDADRDKRAQELVTHRQISAPTFMPNATIRMGFNGVVSCTCQDFVGRGGACKHIRGAFFILAELRQQNINIPDIPIPRSIEDARALQASTVLTIRIPPQSQLPTVRAAEKIADILHLLVYDFKDSSTKWMISISSTLEVMHFFPLVVVYEL